MRPSKQTSNLRQAMVAAERTTCIRRAVGCVMTDKDDYVLSVGRNGVPTGQEHCNEGHPCPAHDAPSGTNLSGCRAIHAEINAIAHCSNPREVHSIYVTVSPCSDCMKALLALPNAKFLYFPEVYERHAAALDDWKKAGRTWAIVKADGVPRIDGLHVAGALTIDEVTERLRLMMVGGSKTACMEAARDLHEEFYLFPRSP